MKKKSLPTKRTILKTQTDLWQSIYNLSMRISTLESTLGNFIEMQGKKDELLEFIKEKNKDGISDK